MRGAVCPTYPATSSGAVGLDQMTLGDDAQGAQDLAEQPGDGRLAGAGVAGEHEVVAGLQRREPPLLAQALDAQQAGEPPYVGLDLLQTDQRVELGQQLLDRPRRRQLRRCRGGCRGRSRTGGRTARAPVPGPGNAGCVERREQHVAVPVDGGDLVGGRHEVDRRRGMSQADAVVVVAGGACRAVAFVGAQEEVEECARSLQPVPLAVQHLALPQAFGGDQHGRFEAGADVVEPGLELGDGPALVAVDHGGDEVTGVDDDVAPMVGSRQLAELGRDAVDEGVDVLGERPGHGPAA